MRFTGDDIKAALTKLTMLRFWPAEPDTRIEAGELLARMVPSREALDWLTDAMLRDGEWKGPGDMRRLLASRFTPADGDDGSILTEERAYFERQAEETTRTLAARTSHLLTGGTSSQSPPRRRTVAEPPRIDRSIPLSEAEAQLAADLETAPRLTDEQIAARIAQVQAALEGNHATV